MKGERILEVIDRKGERVRRVCAEHLVTFAGKRCPKCAAWERTIYEQSMWALGLDPRRRTKGGAA